MGPSFKPLYLFADSQLLFWKRHGGGFLHSIAAMVSSDVARAAYIGASNGDQREFYELFVAAMEQIGVHNCRMIMSDFPVADQEFLEHAEIILLAGGDTEQGWKTFQRVGLSDWLARKHCSGAVLIGISAGAIQLGLCGRNAAGTTFETLQLVPFVIDVHAEQENWKTLRSVVQARMDYVPGIGIPAGGGMIYHPDKTVEAVRHPLHEYFYSNDLLSHRLLFPPPG